MNLVKVKESSLKMKCGCYNCRKIIKEISLMYADLDGEPFRSYYCEDCKQEIINNERITDEEIP